MAPEFVDVAWIFGYFPCIPCRLLKPLSLPRSHGMDCASSASLRTTRMPPRPPPPPDAFDDHRIANTFWHERGSHSYRRPAGRPDLEGAVGTPAFHRGNHPDTLSPSGGWCRFRTPIKIKPERSTCSAKLAFSRKEAVTRVDCHRAAVISAALMIWDISEDNFYGRCRANTDRLIRQQYVFLNRDPRLIAQRRS